MGYSELLSLEHVKLRHHMDQLSQETIVTIVKEKILAEISISTDLIAFPAARKGER
ncbi:MAG: hypothetical protein R2883_01640 [Caldisericia bacterium]